MKGILGIELRNINIKPGIEHEEIFAEVYLKGEKIGELHDDGWIDEIYLEFVDSQKETEFKKTVRRFNTKNKLDDNNINMFINSLLFLNKQYRGIKDKKNPECFQITFMSY